MSVSKNNRWVIDRLFTPRINRNVETPCKFKMPLLMGHNEGRVVLIRGFHMIRNEGFLLSSRT